MFQENYYTLISPSFFYNNQRIVLVSNNKDLELTIELFWQNLTMLISNVNIQLYNLPFIIQDNITNKIYLMSIKQTIRDDYRLYREVIQRKIIPDSKGPIGFGRNKKYKKELTINESKYFNLLNKADVELNTLNIDKETLPKLETVFIFPISKDNELYSLPSLITGSDLIFINLDD
jgi:hypothetical protein